ncbi:MAG TPA: aldose epimerase family protein [Niastella sp.]|nr:aldose epimerase family protein [Niastella sp.]
MMNEVLTMENRFRQKLEGKDIGLVVIRNSKGLQAAITNYGARWVSLLAPDKAGMIQDVVIGYDSIAGYLTSPETYYGATIGRCANRISKGTFYLDGKKYQLTPNHPSGHLHGGKKGFHAVGWDFEKVGGDSVTLSYKSKDGEEGYPGNLKAQVTYSLTEMNEMQISFQAETDETTIVNLTNHAYFNLNGQGHGTILNHALQINADHYTPMDVDSIPVGDIVAVTGTPFDFRTLTAIGERIKDENVQLKNGKGYDHNFVLNKRGDALTIAATAIGDATGIRMDVYTTEPGIQLYTGNFMTGQNILKGGNKDEYRSAFCLETQHFPDAPNHETFPSIVLQPGETYNTTTVFRFSIAG